MKRDETPRPERGGLHAWIVTHDERVLFVVAYITLAVVLSLWISLFWLLVVVGVHVLFELVRQASCHCSMKRILLEALWEVKLDLALVLFALALALYMDMVLGVLGLQQAARLGTAARTARAGGRFVVWQRVLRGVALSIDDVFNAGRFIRPMLRLRRREASQGEPTAPDDVAVSAEPEARLPANAPYSSWRQAWNWGDRLALGLAVGCTALILFSPILTHHTPSTTFQTLAAELHPYPK